MRAKSASAPVPTSHSPSGNQSGTTPGALSFSQRAGFGRADAGRTRVWNAPWSHGSIAEMPQARWLRQLSSM